MHILHIVQLYHPVPSGASRYFVEIGERLVAEGHRVTVLTTNAFDLEHLWMQGRRTIDERTDSHNGVQVVRFPVSRLPVSPLLYPVIRRLMVELSRLPLAQRFKIMLLRRMAVLTPQVPQLSLYLNTDPHLKDVSLVHTTNITLDFALLPVFRWAQQRHIPHICTPFIHLGEPDNDHIRRYYTMPHQIDMLRQSAVVITQTNRESHFLQNKGVPYDKMHKVGVGVSPDEIQNGNAKRFRQQHQIDGPMVLTMGVAAYDKGTTHTVKALQQLWAQGIQATWVQIGPLMNHFEQLVASLPEQDRQHMRILGYVDNETRQDALAAAQLFVLPSRTDSFGIVYLEAWLYGVPCIGADAGGVPEVILHGTNGLLVPFGDVAKLAAAIQQLLHNREVARAMGEAGRKRVLAEYTWDHKYAQVRELYQQIFQRYT